MRAMVIRAMFGLRSYRNQGYGANACELAREELRKSACLHAWHQATKRCAGRTSAQRPGKRAMPAGIPSYSFWGMFDLEKERKP